MSVLVSSTLQINPDIPEAHALRGWYDQGGCSSVNDLSSGGSTADTVGGASSQRTTWIWWKGWLFFNIDDSYFR